MHSGARCGVLLSSSHRSWSKSSAFFSGVPACTMGLPDQGGAWHLPDVYSPSVSTNPTNKRGWMWASRRRLTGSFVRSRSPCRAACRPPPHRMRLHNSGRCVSVSICRCFWRSAHLTSHRRWRSRSTSRCHERSSPACTHFRPRCPCSPRRNGRCNCNYNCKTCISIHALHCILRPVVPLTLPNRQNCFRSCCPRRR